MSSSSALPLSALCSLVREAIALNFAEAISITAEISEMRTAGNGHCYLSLVEKEQETGHLLAKVPAHIWKGNYGLIRHLFRRHTGRELAAGMKVLAEVEVEFHEVFGFSLNIIGIDPTYTLGDIERRRQEILEKLEAEGVTALNKELPLPRPLRRIAVVSSASAAGYGDFSEHLQRSGLSFRTELFEAIMQGNDTEASVLEALEAINERADEFDAAVIIRGGGATADLLSLETYMLAAAVAQFPIPVFTGIGHERDTTVLDFVAHSHFKTPTAVAAFLIERHQGEIDLLRELHKALLHESMLRLSQAQRRFGQIESRTRELLLTFKSKEALRLSRLQMLLNTLPAQSIRRHGLTLSAHRERLAGRSQHRLSLMQQEQEHLAHIIKHLDPKNVLQRGFSLTLIDGKVVKDADSVEQGAHLTTLLAKGKIESTAI